MSRVFDNPTQSTRLRPVYCRQRKAFCKRSVFCRQCICRRNHVYVKNSDICVQSVEISTPTSGVTTRNNPATSDAGSSTSTEPATTLSSGGKEKVSADTTSNTGLIVGICIGLLAVIICALVFLYLRRKRKCHRIKKFGNDPCQVDLKSQNRTSAVESPTSPSYDYAYYESKIGGGPIGAKPPAQGMGNPVYGNNIRISNPFKHESETDGVPFQQPVYQELDVEQVYADPDSTQGAAGGHHEEPVYRIVDETESPNSPIYREVDETPMYAETVEVPASQGGDVTYQKQYQELNYASSDNVYQPLSNDWESRKYNR